MLARRFALDILFSYISYYCPNAVLMTPKMSNGIDGKLDTWSEDADVRDSAGSSVMGHPHCISPTGI